jgi:hypothetical protein
MGRKAIEKEERGIREEAGNTEREERQGCPQLAGAKKDDTSHFCPPFNFQPSNLPPPTFISLLLLYHSALNYFASH